ncbi:hypothetical protein DFH06DRAFT_653852 [Mycena polygramma]|nr:hypothetical protein DFH06DRAFT_653852 [Mycena polygramma]
MDVEHKGDGAKPRVTEPGAEAAAAKIWAIYIGEAEKYDKGLVESWRSDMDGMLIFAGLFSASLTAFLIESYKTLNPDSGDSTVRLLSQISQQLAASANGSTFVVPTPPTFAPSRPALVCNALWFISLGLSLSCALVATLLEQWARDFIHRSEIRSAPLIRARIFSFLYYGLKRFNMHAVVEIIPLLLHTALLFFLAGLVAFLIPVNTAMAVVAAVMLAILTAVYSSLTVLPLCCLDSPYRTPLSGVCWRAVQRLRVAWQRRHTLADGKPGVHPHKEDETMLEAVFHRATEDCDERAARDDQALVWTVKSLSDERELEPFVEAIPSILWDPDLRKRRLGYVDHFRQLVLHPEVELYARIKGLLDSCGTGILPLEAKKHRQIVCFKALCAMTTSFMIPNAPTESLELERYNPCREQGRNEVYSCFVSASALIQWANFYALKPRIRQVLEDLSASRGDNLIARDEKLKLTPVVKFLTALYREWGERRDRFNFPTRSWKDNSEPSVFLPTIPEHVKSLRRILNSKPHDIRLRYLERASMSHSLPYSFKNTLAIIQPPQGTLLPQETYNVSLCAAVSRQLRDLNGPDIEWMDTVVGYFLRDWSTQETPGSIAALSGLVDYLNGRQCDNAVRQVIWRADHRGWLLESFAQSLHDGPDDWKKYDSPPTLPELLMALWRYTSLGFPRWCPSATSFQAVLAELNRFGTLSFTPSVLVLLKFRYLRTYPDERPDPIFPTESALLSAAHEDTDHGIGRRGEASIPYLAEFLQSCVGPDPIPYKAVETLQYLDFLPMTGAVHETHQIRLADAVREVFANPRCADLRTALVNKTIFDLYAGITLNPAVCDQAAWLDNKAARGIIQHAFATYAEELSASTDSPAGLERVRTILREFDRLHSDVETLQH